MPQMFIDYSDNIQNLDKKKLMLGLNHALFDTGLVGHEHDIKSRIQEVTDYLIGFGDENGEESKQAFIFVRLQGLSGRTEQQKDLMTESLSQFLQSFQNYSADGLEIQLCVEFAEMPREIYKKVIVKAK
ncbi:5-carboxymethyl-2-hydroxymuconate Delta-isomerase [Acinetobacter rongchengensis]|uniref:5-carboxymethyl-2-hydroxymuconate isomerase n=1 Tax=Acinetobacter rongchengensis TaxID=2419601 RepID=A0A3A8F3U4_9GAMM|nr:5-carboxymethyl-2-hydroxymuconate isomerase [Acinetobacter rongchengensis]RKG41009.1 5-carboxymethyl-2-hydroxymuconate isomerase [Acinetobacter rongchengensis]